VLNGVRRQSLHEILFLLSLIRKINTIQPKILIREFDQLCQKLYDDLHFRIKQNSIVLGSEFVLFSIDFFDAIKFKQFENSIIDYYQ